METELERMIVRIVGDSSSLMKMATETKAAVAGMANDLMKATDAVQGFTRGLSGFAGQALSLLGSLGFATSLYGAFNAFAALERGQIRLRAAIESNGGAVQQTLNRYHRFAEAETKMSLDTKSTVYQLLQQAEMLGYTGDAAMRVVKRAMDLADATEREASGLIRVTAAMEENNYALLKRLPGLRHIKNETELVAKAEEMMARGARIDTAMFNSAAGMVERLGRSLKFLATEIGALIGKAVVPAMEYIQLMIEQFRQSGDAIRGTASKVALAVLIFVSLPAILKVAQTVLAPFVIVWNALTMAIGFTIAALRVLFVVSGAQTIILFVFRRAAALVQVAMVLLGATSLAVSATVTTVNTAFQAVTLTFKLLTLAINILAGIITAIVLAPIFIALYLALRSVWAVIKQVVSSLRELASTGNFSVIVAMVQRWWGLLKEIYTLSKTNMPQAFELLKAGFAVILEDMKAMWTHFSTFLSDSIRAIASTISHYFRLEFAALRQQARRLSPFVDEADVANNLQGIRDRQQTYLNDMSNVLRTNVNFLVEDITNATQTPGQVAANNALEELRNRLGAASRDGERGGERIGAGINRGIQRALGKFDAAEFGSVEAIARIQSYVDELSLRRVTGGNDRAAIEDYRRMGAYRDNFSTTVSGSLAIASQLGLQSGGLGGPIIGALRTSSVVAQGAASSEGWSPMGYSLGGMLRAERLLAQMLEELRRQNRNSGLREPTTSTGEDD